MWGSTIPIAITIGTALLLLNVNNIPVHIACTQHAHHFKEMCRFAILPPMSCLLTQDMLAPGRRP